MIKPIIRLNKRVRDDDNVSKVVVVVVVWEEEDKGCQRGKAFKLVLHKEVVVILVGVV